MHHRPGRHSKNMGFIGIKKKTILQVLLFSKGSEFVHSCSGNRGKKTCHMLKKKKKLYMKNP